MYQLFDPVVLRLIGLLKAALPDSAEEDIFWGYHFVTGALMLTLARTGRIDKLSGGLCQSGDYAAVKQRMAGFLAAGRSEGRGVGKEGVSTWSLRWLPFTVTKNSMTHTYNALARLTERETHNVN